MAYGVAVHFGRLGVEFQTVESMWSYMWSENRVVLDVQRLGGGPPIVYEAVTESAAVATSMIDGAREAYWKRLKPLR